MSKGCGQFRVVAALVLLDILSGVMAFRPVGPGIDAKVVLGGAVPTVNIGNSFVAGFPSAHGVPVSTSAVRVWGASGCVGQRVAGGLRPAPAV